MNSFQQVTNKQTFKLFAIFLLLFSLIYSSVPQNVILAAKTNGDESGDYGDLRNDEGGREYERATIDKQVSFGNKPGEYFIDLTVRGKVYQTEEKTDIVIVYDNSNSMKTNNRVGIAQEATTAFVNELLDDDNANDPMGYRLALVTYGSAVFDERHRDWANYPGTTANWSHKIPTKSATDITNKIPSNTPDQRTDGGNRNISTWHGGTFTQQGLEEAGKILDSSDADQKIIVTITDGATTFSYGNRGSVEGNGSTYINSHGTRTTAEAKALMDKGYFLYSIGVEMDEEDGITEQEAKDLVKSFASSEDHYYDVTEVKQLQNALEEIANRLKQSVFDGYIEDPMGEYFQLKGASNFTPASDNELEDGSYFLSASDSELLEGVTVSVDGQKIKVDGLNLGENEEIALRYKVQIDTEKEGFEIDKLYRTNGETTLTPVAGKPNEKNEFPEPWASGKGISVVGEKIWEDFGLIENRPKNLIVKLMNGDEEVDRVTVTPDENGDWNYEFEDAVWYDSNGEFIEYTFDEEPIDGYEMIENTGKKIVNKLIDNPKINLVKTGESTSALGEDVIEVGKDIEYMFTITNTGNLPLKDIDLSDQLEGISKFDFISLNDEDFNGSIEDLVLQSGDVLIATATYTVTQEDFDHGRVDNKAKVVGTPTMHDPSDPNSPQPVEDVDDANVPGELEPGISLTKKADRESVSEVDELITYTFIVTNTGNTTLTNVKLIDDMLGGEIELTDEQQTLLPGDKFTIERTYIVTQDDINTGEILNEADVEGTPPPAYTDNPDNPDKVTDKDDETVKAEQKSGIELVKEADKEELVTGEMITYTFTASNTGNTTLTNVEITDILDGISDIAYLTVNDDSNFDKDNIVLEPGDVLVAEATYEVTQEDVDFGQVFNEATVTGIDRKGEEVTDEDDEVVPSIPRLGLELVKTSDKQYVTEAGEEIEYTFEVTNTSNVTLKDVVVKDPMLKDLGIDIVLDKTTLKPGETATGKATYTVTEKDIEAGNIENVATATGTPPNPKDEPPTSPPAEDNVLVARIQLEKSVLPGIYTEIGQELTYTLVVTNTGEVTLNDVVLNDDMLGGDIELDVDSLEPGEATEVEVPYKVTEADVETGETVNTAATEGTPEGYDPEDPNTPGKVTDEDEATAQYAGLVIQKTSNKEEVEEAGEVITYTFEVTNVGKVTLENVVVNDDMLAELDIEVELEKTTLAPGESTTGTAVYTVTQADIDNGGVYNVATTTGTPPGYDPEDPEYPDEPPVSPPSEDNVPSKQDSKITLEKVADIDEYTEVGDEIVYTFTVTNAGKTTLSDVKVDDETFKVEINLGKTTLAPGESTIGTYTYTVTREDLNNGEIHNFANTEGTPPPVIDPEDPDNPVEQDPVTDEDDEKVPGNQNADLALEKVSDKEFVERAGDEITYTLTVTNTGNVTLTDVTVNDEMLGGDLKITPSILAPGEKGTVTGTYVVTQDDIDRQEEIINIATATGTPPGGDPEDPENPETPPVEEEVPVVDNPEITLVKLADKEKLVEGETITYTFTATNTGNTTLEYVNLVDELEGISEIDYLTVNDEDIDNLANITLKPGDVLVATATYEITQEDVNANEIYNHAIVEGTPPSKENPEDPDNPIEQEPVTDDDEARVPSEHKPEITLDKSTEKQLVTEAGEVITYKFVVTNTGNVTLDNVRVNDPMLDAAGIKIELEKKSLVPGESTVGYADYTVTQDDIDNAKDGKIVNIATVTGTPPGGDPYDPDNPQSPPSKEEVPIEKKPAISLVKSSDTEKATKVGQLVTYTFVITNTGNTTLENILLDDPMLGGKISLPETTLTPGEDMIVEQTYKVTSHDLENGDINNIAEVSGQTPGEDTATVRDKDTDNITTEKSEPGQTLPKTATNDFNLILMGSIIFMLGIMLLLIRERNRNKSYK